MSNFYITTYKSVTELSDKGLFLFNGPNNYIKFTSENASAMDNGSKTSVVSVDRIITNEILYKGIPLDNFEVSSGGSGTGDLTGTGASGSISIWTG